MYEGKHIHFSEVDNKPLCSYSTKLCKQRRLNGYAFCIRHVLEDSTAPFKQCEFVAKYNQLRCTNPIPGDENRQFCNSHMQVLGLAPKRGKKRKGDQSPDSRNDTASSKGGSQDREKHKKKSKDKKKKKKKKKKKEKHKNKGTKPILVDGFIESKDNSELTDLSFLYGAMPPECLDVISDGSAIPISAVEKPNRTKTKRRKDGSTLHERLQEKLERNKQRLRQQREKAMLAKASRHKSHDKLGSQASPSLHDGGSQYNSSYLDGHKLLPGAPPLVEGKGRVPSVPSPQLPQRSPVLREAYVKLQQKHPRDLFARKLDSLAVDRLRERFQHDEMENTDLFPLGLDFSDTEDEESEEVTERRCKYTIQEHCSLSSIPSTEESPRPSSRPERLKQLKALLQRGRRKVDVSLQCSRLEHCAMRRSSKLLADAAREHPFGAAVSILRVQEEILQRPKPQAPPERICCSKEENADPCQEEAMPYSKHCFRHILEDEEQVLFYQCGAEFPGGFRCIEPSFDMLNEQPLCLEHAKRVRMEPKTKRPRKKTKPSALTRPFKKKKKNQHRKVRPQKPIPPLEPLQNYQLPTLHHHMAAPRHTAPAASLRSPSPLGPHDLPEEIMDISALEEAMNVPVDSLHDQDELNSDAEEEALSSILPNLNLNALFAGKNGDFLPTKEEAEALERALFQDENLSHQGLGQFASDLLDDGECENGGSLPGDVPEAAISQDSSDGLPSDLQSAANRLIADTIRQNSNDGSHQNAIQPSSNLTNSVPLSNLNATQPGQTFTLPTAHAGHPIYTNSVAQFNGNMLPQTQALLTQTGLGTATAAVEQNHQDSLRHTVLNGLMNGNQPRAMLSQFPVSQPMSSPHGQQVPHPMMSPQSPQVISTTLPQVSPSVTHSPAATSQSSQQNALPSFRQTWSMPNMHNAMLRSSPASMPAVNGINTNGGLPYAMQITSQSVTPQKLPGFNTVMAEVTQNHIQQQQQTQQGGFAPGLPSPQTTSGMPTTPFAATTVKNITPTIKQQGT